MDEEYRGLNLMADARRLAKHCSAGSLNRNLPDA